MSPLRIGILGSTRGTDMRAIIEAIDSARLDARITIVVSDRKRAGILDKARDAGLPCRHIPTRADGIRRERIDFDQELSSLLEEYETQLIVCVGFMRILSPWFCQRWEGRIINVHPSLLPEFAGGMDGDVHSAVIAAGRQQSGCSVHLITSEVDQGEILLQKRCPVLPEDSPETLKQRVQQLEGEALVEVIERFAANT